MTSRWRLRALLALLIALSALLMARVDYLTRSARFHQHEAARYAEMIRQQGNITPVEVELALETARKNPDDPRLNYKYRRVLHHSAVAQSYQVSVYRPWLVVHEPPAPVWTYED